MCACDQIIKLNLDAKSYRSIALGVESTGKVFFLTIRRRLEMLKQKGRSN